VHVGQNLVRTGPLNNLFQKPMTELVGHCDTADKHERTGHQTLAIILTITISTYQ